MRAVERDFEIVKSFHRSLAAFARALDEVLLDQERFVDFFEGIGIFAGGDGPGVEADWASAVSRQEALHQTVVDLFQASRIDVEELSCRAKTFFGEFAVGANLRVIPHSAQQAVGDAWGAPASFGN